MKVIVTGAAGFIGFHLSRNLNAHGYEVLGIDNFNNYYNPDLKRLREKNLKNLGVEILDFDIRDAYLLGELIRKFDPEMIIHLAAQAGVRLTKDKMMQYVDANLTGFGNVLSQTIVNEIPFFIYASSSSVYGDSPNYPYRETETNLNPKSFYGGTKLSNELLAKIATHNSKTRSRGLRFFTVYGEFGRPDMAYFKLANAALAKKEFKLFGDGTILRDFTYIDDNIESIRLLAENLASQESGFSDIVNIGGGKPNSMQDLIKTIENILEIDIKVSREPSFSGDVVKTIASIEYQEKLIGKIPKTSLHDGLVKFLAWAKVKIGRAHV